MPLFESRDALEYKRAIQKYYGKTNFSSESFTLTGKSGIIEKWDDTLHPRDENGRFTNAGGITSPLVNGPAETNSFVESYFAEHPEVAKEADKYMNVLENVQNFAANHPGAKEGTYNAVTGEPVNPKDLNGYCVTFHQNLSLENPYGAYTPENYAAMCAISINELGAKSVNIGYFGGAAEVSFVTESQTAAVDFAISQNQHSVFDPAVGDFGDAIVNAYFDPATNIIEGH